MTDLTISRNPPNSWDAYCQANNYLFHSHAWQKLLENAFRCRTSYGWNESADYGMAISGFSAGPFKIGYLGFPVGGLVGNRKPGPEILKEWDLSRSLFNCHCLRLPVSAFEDAQTLALPYRSNPETAICDLQSWDINQVSKKLRRDIKKARRTNLTITDASSYADGSDLYSIYKGTIQRHSGSLRYNEKYFSSVTSLAGTHPGLRCMIARSEDRVAGFAIIARHKQTTYYLHGGTDLSLRHLSPSDLLLHEAILWAQENGSNCFNLMTSSSNQPSLVRYKEKWGAVTRQHRTYTLSLNLALCASFNIAERAYNLLRKAVAPRQGSH